MVKKIFLKKKKMIVINYYYINVRQDYVDNSNYYYDVKLLDVLKLKLKDQKLKLYQILRQI